MSQKYSGGFKARAVVLVEERICVERCLVWWVCCVFG